MSFDPSKRAKTDSTPLSGSRAVKDTEEASDDSEADVATFELHFEKKREFYGAAAALLLVRLSTVSGVAEWKHEL